MLSSTIAQAQQADVVLAVGTITDDAYPGREAAGNGLGDMILTEVVNKLGAGGEAEWCAGRVVEWRRIDEVIKEQKFQQSKYADPTTAIKKLGTEAPDFLIGGRITFGGGKANWTIETRTNPGGDLVDSFSGFSDDDAFLDEAARIAEHVLDKLCPGPWTVSGGGARIKVSGTVVKLSEPFEVVGKFPGGTSAFVYTPTSRSGGTVEYGLAGGGFSGAGKGTYTIGPSGDGSTLTIKQTTKGCINGVPGSCKTNSEVLTLTPVSR
ncbi:hypothetical protein LAC81_34450 (plasmid) [Ensifer adhaerens]|uniref:hypothetical protein n=1 Tax=Ensifer adhaerens TaxID=106592 RepID=UPI001CBB4745|nr:hypothetical protein [Ensifer adhaerens]MBZ7927061.1 hypothetical protein [Ensifer adhaerens]UAX98110.1 hypothetical protein LAC78_35750 [Ensifer adhaerens]UAY05491.1 hypothetical protein LAC80_34455 [Ensifer adhaerens]UAY12869.1 hypothetical protein LAC81_34450 [Ensifer adhaerens]